jgi:glycosyltransferase involved in cell wall biosynthesis
MRLHVVSLPTTQVTADYLTCAYTQKVRKFCDMMSPDHDVFLYAGDECDVKVTELVPCTTREEQATHGFNGPDDYMKIQWNPAIPYWNNFNCKALTALNERVEAGDIICVTSGDHWPLNPIGAIKRAPVVEFGIGYQGVFADYQVFESYAWMHAVYGWRYTPFGSFFCDRHTVIPNFFDPADFHISEGRGDYLLYVGRLTKGKGWRIAQQVCEEAGYPFFVAGPQGDEPFDGYGTYLGILDATQRADWMANARAVFVPTQYLAPFEGVHVEAQLCGTPVITSDFGVFTETVTARNGRRCRTYADYLAAAKHYASHDTKPDSIRAAAVKRFSLDAVRPMYEKVFADILSQQG